MEASSDSNILKSIKLGCILTFTLVILGALGRFILDPADRNRCSSLLERGQWIDDSYSQWQPSQCMMHTYKPAEISTCLGHSRILYIGDSIARQQFLSTVSLLKPKISLYGEPHVNRKYILDGVELEFWWDPYLNTTATVQLLEGQSPLVKPSLLVIESGAWHMHYLGEAYFDQWKKGIDHLFKSTSEKEVADALVLGPVEVPTYDKLSKNRTNTMTLEKIEKMNLYLKEKQDELKKKEEEKRTPVAVAFVWNQVSALASNMTEDGLHFNSTVTTIQTQIALNYRCNDLLDKKFPMDTTCCYSYSGARWYQYIWMLFFLVWVPVGYYLVSSGTTTTIKYFPSDTILHALFVFGLCVVYMYLGDRTQLFGKIHKHFDASVFIGLMIGTVVLGMMKLSQNKKEGDLGFLNRNQTDEWKGWMQMIILVYHFCGASGTSGIYNAVRILVAAYLFQTGYGHFFYFYKKADFGFGRILNVMVRLNLLTFVLQYFMDTNYLSYYFTPLVSFWFLVIWCIMYVGHSWNKKNWWFILIKLAVGCILTTCLIQVPGVLESVFGMLKTCFNVQWDAAEWRFRLALDAYIVYIGMLCAYAVIKISEHKLTDHARWYTVKYTSFILSVIALVWYFWFELSLESKFVYNTYHPYISWVPILAFILLRNGNTWLRNTHSEFFSFIGKISLETFIGQFHMWLAGDTKGLLVILPFSSYSSWWWWWLNLGVSSCLFLFVCYYTSQSTQHISGWLCKLLLNKSSSTQQHVPASSSEYQPVPLLPTTGTHKDQQGEEEEIWDTSFSSEKKPNRMILFLNDTRVKSLFILLVIGLLNNLC